MIVHSVCFSSAQEVINTIPSVLAVDCILSDVGAVDCILSDVCELIKSMLPSRPVRFQGFFFSSHDQSALPRNAGIVGINLA